MLFPIVVLAQSINSGKTCKKRKVEKWEQLANEGNYQEAINLLLKSMEENKNAHKHRDYWHIGQYFALDNNYNKAIIYLKKSTNIFQRSVDREWRLYYKGTIAFLKRNKRDLKKYHDKLWKNHSGYYEKNACRLKALYENFEKPYKDAYYAEGL